MGPFDDDDEDLYDDDLPGNYPAADDIFSRKLIDEEIDPEFVGREKFANEEKDSWNEKDFEEDLVGDDLDIPGDDLDEEEIEGNEDEENSYFSLGGDNHNDLEENQGD